MQGYLRLVKARIVIPLLWLVSLLCWLDCWHLEKRKNECDFLMEIKNFLTCYRYVEGTYGQRKIRLSDKKVALTTLKMRYSQGDFCIVKCDCYYFLQEYVLISIWVNKYFYRIKGSYGMFDRRDVIISLIKRSMVSVLIVLTFIVGKNIPNPYFDIKLVNSKSAFYFYNYYHNFSLFGVGLAPWMSGTIITDLLAKYRKWTQSRKQWTSKILIVVIAVLQSYTRTSNVNGGVITRVSGMVIFVTGSILVMWLSNMNFEFGIGGPFILFVANISISIISVLDIVYIYNFNILFVFFVLTFSLIVLMVNTIVNRAERRIIIIHTTLSNQFSRKSYLPIKLALAGSMPVMFGMSFFEVIHNIIRVLHSLFIKNKMVYWLSTNFNYNSYFGVIMYIIFVFLLTLVLGYLQVSPHEQAENLQFNGEFVPGVYPGDDTENFLKKIIIVYSGVYGAYLVLISGAPLLLSSGSLMRASLLMLPSIEIMLTDFILRIIDEINIIWLNKKYGEIFLK
ncbi:hypothetical protein LTA00_13485 [Lactiplantibacillus plantarum]|uniref:hypothetical protein n=1 Tax=Lactiplantibacillus plantarum TaxID=1590 RepID=UPI0020064A48|nr:hypothetical protein [Lactiplantibacillus plantarum]MCK6240592.1 hypothetical protein [Lactiplantibacillus plantarum]